MGERGIETSAGYIILITSLFGTQRIKGERGIETSEDSLITSLFGTQRAGCIMGERGIVIASYCTGESISERERCILNN